MLSLNFAKNAKVWEDYVWAHGLNNIPLPARAAVEETKSVDEKSVAVEGSSESDLGVLDALKKIAKSSTLEES
jgi:hypothetical protein